MFFSSRLYHHHSLTSHFSHLFLLTIFTFALLPDSTISFSPKYISCCLCHCLLLASDFASHLFFPFPSYNFLSPSLLPSVYVPSLFPFYHNLFHFLLVVSFLFYLCSSLSLILIDFCLFVFPFLSYSHYAFYLSFLVRVSTLVLFVFLHSFFVSFPSSCYHSRVSFHHLKPYIGICFQSFTTFSVISSHQCVVSSNLISFSLIVSSSISVFAILFVTCIFQFLCLLSPNFTTSLLVSSPSLHYYFFSSYIRSSGMILRLWLLRNFCCKT